MLHEDKELCFRMRLPYMPCRKVAFSGGDGSANSAASLLTLRNFVHLTTPNTACLKLLFQRYKYFGELRKPIENII